MSFTTASPALALLTRLHSATRELDALHARDADFNPVLAVGDTISGIADELAALLGVDIGDAWAPLIPQSKISEIVTV